MGPNKMKCDECGNLRRSRNVVRHKSKFLCFTCRQKLPSTRLQKSISQSLNPDARKTLKEALNRVYEVKPYVSKKGKLIAGGISPPQILIGRKVKFVLVDEEDEKEK